MTRMYKRSPPSSSHESGSLFSPEFRPNPDIFDIALSESKKRRPPPVNNYVCPCPPMKSPFRSHLYQPRRTVYTPTARGIGTPQSILLEERGDSPTEAPHFEVAFDNLGKIGYGSFADVFKVRAHIDGQPYAIKRAKRPFKGEKDRQRSLREVRAHSRLSSHPHILSLKKAWEEKGILFIQTEYCERGSLRDFLYESTNVPETIVWNFATDLLLALKHIHSNGLLHLDIKPSNIFLSHLQGRACLKVGDFGLATVINSTIEDMEGDSSYVAPELLDWNREFGEGADIFSLGLTLYEMCENVTLPSQHCEFYEQLRSGTLRIKSPPYSSDLQELIFSMMIPSPSRRYNEDQLLSHPRIQEILEERRKSKLYGDDLSALDLDSSTEINTSLDDDEEDFDRSDQLAGEPLMIQPRNLSDFFQTGRTPTRNLVIRSKGNLCRAMQRQASLDDATFCSKTEFFSRGSSQLKSPRE